MDQQTWIIWLIFTIGFCIFVIVEVAMRYLRFKHEPSAWTARVASIGVTLWVIAVMAVANLFRLGWTPWTALTAIIVGVGYAAAIVLVGRVVRERAQARGDESGGA
jgi:uncharacterized membrane protein YecN with MAPEG domain